MLNWEEYRGQLGTRLGEFNGLAPEAMKSLNALGAAPGKAGKLEPKIHELISLAVAVTTRCDGCIAFHAHAAKRAGATEEELAEALTVTISLNAGAAMSYTARTLDASAKA